MEDKDFLGYFSKLGPPSSKEEINSSAHKILHTLVALGSVANRKGSSESINKAVEKAEQALRSKY
jgi:hypothetical protein